MNKTTFFTKGVRHMLAASFWFALMNVFVKCLAHLPTMELIFFRCGAATLIGFVGLHMKNISWIGSNRKLLLLRGISGTLALYLFFLTLQHLPLGTAVTIQYLSPIFTTIVAIFILGEKVKIPQWFFFLISFLGVFMIKGFNTHISWSMFAAGVASSLLSGFSYNFIRTLKEKEHPYVVVLHFQLLGAITGLVFTLFNWQMPEGVDWLYIILIGVFTQLGQIQLTKSLQAENVARVTILNYLGIVYALFFGWLLFGETHTFSEMSGILLVVGGIVLNIIFTTRENKKTQVTQL